MLPNINEWEWDHTGCAIAATGIREIIIDFVWAEGPGKWDLVANWRITITISGQVLRSYRNCGRTSKRTILRSFIVCNGRRCRLMMMMGKTISQSPRNPNWITINCRRRSTRSLNSTASELWNSIGEWVTDIVNICKTYLFACGEQQIGSTYVLSRES